MKITRSVKSDININVETNEGNKMGHGPKGKEYSKGHDNQPQELNTLSPDKQAACDLIKQAIDKLSACAETDEIARDSIANLGVVLLDLKG